MIDRPNEVRCTCREWLEHGPAIVRQRHVERVTLTDKNPPELVEFFLADAGVHPTDGDPFGLPSCLFSWLGHWPAVAVHYRSHTQAADALSAACLAWAKSCGAPARA